MNTTAANSTNGTDENKHNYSGKQPDSTGPAEPSDVSNNTVENSEFAPHISVNHKGNKTDVRIDLTMSWNGAFTQKQVDEAKAGIEKYWSGTFESDGKIYTIRTHITEVGADPLVGSGHKGLLDMQLCADCGKQWGGLTLPGGSTMHLSESVAGKEQWEINAAHEFGHAMGLYHQYNSTHDIMSYAEDRRLTLWDIQQVVKTYGGGG
ncbi:MAG: hypothetical protein ACRD4Q_12685 [Candidatus Acidiferrales bacterium]